MGGASRAEGFWTVIRLALARAQEGEALYRRSEQRVSNTDPGNVVNSGCEQGGVVRT